MTLPRGSLMYIMDNGPAANSSSSSFSQHLSAMNIPFEIWLHIASYIPTEHLQMLYAVNHALFVISMDERYREIDLSGDSKETIPKILTRLRYSAYVKRVHKLHLAPDSLAIHLDPKGTNQKWNVETMIPRLFRRRNYMWTTAFAKMVLPPISSMVNVEEFDLRSTLTWLDPIPAKCLESFLRVAASTAWVTFGSNLRSLTLDLSLQAYYYVLTPSPILPSLEYLSITFTFDPPINIMSDLLRSKLTPFINDHRSTLEWLRMTFITRRHCDVSPHLRGIRHLPCLRKLDIDFDFVIMDPGTSGFRHLLETHSNELRELCFNLPLPYPPNSPHGLSPSEWYMQDIGQVALPRLESLKLGTGCHFILGRTAAYLAQFSGSLTTLKLEQRNFVYQEVETIVNVVAGYERLQKLYLSVVYLDPVLFDLFLTKLPSLHFLHLKFFWICAPEVRQELANETFAFCQAMRERLYRNHKLRHFIGQSTNFSILAEELPSCEVAIGVALPDLHTLRVQK